MRIVEARWLPYVLPLRAAWQSARGTQDSRSGRLLCLTAADGQAGWGECAPLPEAGISAGAAARYAVETALLDLAARSAGCSLGDWLLGRPAPRSIAINAVAGSGKTGVQQADIRLLRAQGFSVIKLKVGLAPVTEELSRLAGLLEAFPATMPQPVRWRLDANGAWSHAEAATFLRACRDWPIDGLEEPLRNPTLAALADLQSGVPFPLAVDESVNLLDDAFFARPPVRRLVLKPPRHGVVEALSLGLRAREAGLECVLTSSLESACGLWLLAHLAAALSPDAVHGLGTADWLLRDTGHAPPVSGGRLWLGACAGSGFSPLD